MNETTTFPDLATMTNERLVDVLMSRAVGLAIAKMADVPENDVRARLEALQAEVLRRMEAPQ